jgi:quercetin dioxygenase-like cupin family protein
MPMRSLTISVVVIMLGASAFAQQQHSVSPVSPNELKWQDGPPYLPKGAQLAVVQGDRTKPEPFAIRLKLPKDYTIPPHTHSKAELVTVISGTFKVGMGEKVDQASMKAMQPGSFVELPAEMPHYAQAADADTIVQISGIGPFDVKMINPQ